MSKEQKNVIGLKAALAVWVEKHASIPDFSRAMKYSYQHSWNLVSSKAPVTDSVVGRFALTYGAEALDEWFALAQSELMLYVQKKSE
mgnify:CR=1 FL=1